LGIAALIFDKVYYTLSHLPFQLARYTVTG